jgi:hypothetical protein
MNYKRLLICSAALIWFSPAACPQEKALEEDKPAKYGAEIVLNSRYVWRGIALSRGLVLQPSANFMLYRNLSVNIWGNFDFRTETGEQCFNESDVTVTYSKDWHKITFEPSIQSYLFPVKATNPNTAEAILTIKYPLKSINVFTRHSFDLVTYRGSHFGEVGIDWEKGFGQRLELSASVSTGWGNSQFNDAYLGMDRSALNVISMQAALSWKAVKHIRVSPRANLSSLVDRRLRRNVIEPDLKWAGLTVNVDF